MIYLDHAATSFPKSPAVLAAMQRWFADVGVSASRGSGTRCQLAAAETRAARQGLARLLGCPATRIAFVSGATEGLNLALRALLRDGDRVLTTAFEHSSVVRPLRALQRERNLQIEIVPPAADGSLPLAAVRTALQTFRPQLLVFTHASNVTGACFDAAALCSLAREGGATTLLDASQTIGLVECNVGADVVVASTHKALGSPPGLGFVAALTRELTPQKQGGTGHSRALEDHPNTWPEAFEAGTPNTPAIFGLAAAFHPQNHKTAAQRLAASLEPLVSLSERLATMPHVRCLLPNTEQRVPVLSLVHAQYDCAELGAMLAAQDLHVRTGHHCAPWLHAHLGTDTTGTVRISTGTCTTAADIDAVVAFFASL